MTKTQWEKKMIRECTAILLLDSVLCFAGTVAAVCTAAYFFGWILAKAI